MHIDERSPDLPSTDVNDWWHIAGEMSAGAQRCNATTLNDDVEKRRSFIVLLGDLLRTCEKAGRDPTSGEGKTCPGQFSIRMAAQCTTLKSRGCAWLTGRQGEA